MVLIALEQDFERDLGRAAALEQVDRRVEVDVTSASEDLGAAPVGAGPQELLDAPGHDLFVTHARLHQLSRSHA